MKTKKYELVTIPRLIKRKQKVLENVKTIKGAMKHLIEEDAIENAERIAQLAQELVEMKNEWEWIKELRKIAI